MFAKVENISLCAITFGSSPLEMFLGKGVLKIWIKFTGEDPCQSVILTKLLCNFIEIALWFGCSPVNIVTRVNTWL